MIEWMGADREDISRKLVTDKDLIGFAALRGIGLLPSLYGYTIH